ncbi:phosphotransferase [Thioclava sp. A2]|uniref:aminoglycoside phosphotransferase family protein n=1 Tax=Thioclava sp. FCG-A2 TaxID=3080562 RepID=UPI002952D503|nr:phosphotransferase [Thioclava sp. A2]MDV7270652.1 phosphotransferase [Thioclava sp. A2]
MTDRALEIAGFLAVAGWGQAACAPLAGDASARRYERLAMGAKTAVLMDAPVGGDTPRFVGLAEWLSAEGYSAPHILAASPERGLLLLEDLGDDLIATLVAADPAREAGLYRAITDFLLDLHARPAPEFLAPLDGDGLAELVTLTPDWYPVLSKAAAEEIPALIAQLYDALNHEAPVMCLRDFHAQNILWLPAREGVARLGLLDFQDAVAAHPAYDLVSVLQDARRDVSATVEHAEIRHYSSQKGLNEARFEAIYALLGAQRSLRILGIFARLSLAFGKAHYVELIPRSWRYIERNLAHPRLRPLANAVFSAYPAPDETLLQTLKDQCGTRPLP